MRLSHWTIQRKRRRKRQRQKDGDERKAPPPAPSSKSSAPPPPTAAGGSGSRNPIFRTSPPDIARPSPVPTTSPCGLATPVVFLPALTTEGVPRMRMLLRAGTAAEPWRRAAASPLMVAAAQQKTGVVDLPELRRGVTGWEVCRLRGSRPAAG